MDNLAALARHATGQLRARVDALEDLLGPEIDTEPGQIVERQLEALQVAMLTDPGAILESGRPYDPQEVHTFPPGLYVRQVTNPAGSLTVTMKHGTDHPYFVLRGHIRVKNLETGEVRDLRGGDSGVTLAGTRRAILALEETVFCTVHPNPDNCRDLAELERRFIVRQELPGGRTVGELYREQLAKMLEEGS
jgi:quercetin dioxygenase-like cupin family protein